MGEVSEKEAYRLRRVGKPSTVVGVKDILPLKHDVTRFGRHSGNDHYLDSKKLENFISRWHSEIHCVLSPGREDKQNFFVKDNSLNGTYVNDVRIDGEYELHEGDFVTFGHRNGKNILPGQLAKQHNSEFYFVFERVDNDPLNTSFVESSQNSQSQPGSPVLPLLGQIHPPNVGQETPTGDSSLHAQVSRQLLGTSTHSAVLRDIALTAGDKFIRCNTPPLVTLDPISHLPMAASTELSEASQQNHRLPAAGAPHHVPLSSSQDEGAIIQQAIVNAENFDAGAESDDDIFIVESGETSEARAVSVGQTMPLVPGVSGNLTPVSVHSSDHVSTASASGVEDIPVDVPVSAPASSTRKNSPVKKSPVKKSPVRAVQTRQVSDNNVPNSDVTSVGVDHQAPGTMRSARSTSPAVTTKAGVTATVHKTKATTAQNKKTVAAKAQKSASAPSTANTSTKSKKAEKNTGKRKRAARGRASAAKRRNSTTATSSNEDDSDDYVWHEDGELCSSANCCKPMASKVFWVQCDDCDQWYHTVCVGCSYDAVKDEDTAFYCGCVQRD